MEHMITAINAVLPLFLLIALGTGARRLRLLSKETAREANGMCFRLFMGPLLFWNIYTADLGSSFNGGLLALCVLGTLAEFFVGLWIAPRLVTARPAQGVVVQALCRPNLVLLGLPIARSLFGAAGAGPVAFAVAVIVPLINVLSVLALELFRDGTPSPRKIFLGVVRNPLILGAVTGTVCGAAGISLPGPLETAVSSIADAATPLALVLMGASLNLGRLRSSGRALAVCTAVRLVLAPLAFLSLGVLLGFRGAELCAVMVAFGAPVAVNSYTMALQMDGDADLAGGIVLLTTGFSCVTLFLWILLLESGGLF